MSTENSSVVRRFIATTPGLSATRWLAFVLGSHPEVFVAHGGFRLDSVVRNDFQEEKNKGDAESLTSGNEMRHFYETASLDQVFDAYRALKPEAKAFGNIHSYTLDALMRRAESRDRLKGIAVANILRHPVCYIDSHSSLVRSAQRHPELYRHYAQNLFLDALREFPELFLIDCNDYRELLAFTVSSLSVLQMANDFAHAGIQHFRMELLTTDSEILKSFCESLTGLLYPRERLDGFIREGPINRHRRSQASMDPWAIYSSWPDWKQDVAFMMIPDSLLDRFEEHGYDIGMLRGKAPSRQTQPAPKPIFCLGDCLKMMDERHPLLALLSPVKDAEPRLLETDYLGYNIVEFLGMVYALACRLGPIDLATLSGEALREHQQRGDCFIGGSREEIKEILSGVTSLIPRIIEGDCYGFNLVRFRGRVYGLACSLGSIDLSRLPAEVLEEYRNRSECFIGESPEEVRDLITRARRLSPILIEAEFHGFNLVGFSDQVYALACSLGPIDLTNLPEQILRQYIAQRKCFTGPTIAEVKAQVLLTVGDGPLLLETEYHGFNVVAYHGRVYALACSLGPLDLAEIVPELLQEYLDHYQCFVGQTIEEVKRGIDKTL